MPISLWLIVDFDSLKMYSIGSSTVTIWQRRRSFTYWSMAAMDVLLPEPVTPAKRMSPLADMATGPSTSGICSCSNVLTSDVIRRQA